MTKYDENYRASCVCIDGEDVRFDFLVVRTDYCEATFVAYGDVYHVVQASVRFAEDGKYKAWEETSLVKHADEIRPLLDTAEEITAFHNGRMAFHSLDGAVTMPFRFVA